MSQSPLEAFRQLVFQDPSLPAQLSAVTNADDFSALAVKLGTERGCQFNTEDVKAALQATQLAWHMREFMRQSQPITTTPVALQGWVPTDIYLLPNAPEPFVEWCYFGTERFTDSFFSQTVNWQMSQPFARLFRLHTPIETLHKWHAQQPGLPIGGFIFHLSRCGSTLMSQMLAALPRNVVLSEAPPFDAILRLPDVSDEQHIARLHALVSALGQPRVGNEAQVWFKLDSWHVLQLPLIERAFPGVPWVFLYRAPVEVLVSHARQRGPQMVPGLIEPQWFGMEPAELDGMDFDEYTARTMRRICEAAWQHRANGQGRLVNYHELPDAMYDLLPHHFGVTLTADDEAALRRAALKDAKQPRQTFSGDAAEKQRQATDHMRALADRWVNPIYQQLETARLSQTAFA